MTEPLVSVNMVTYNHAPFIAQAIDGVLQQRTNFPFELIIGEDCSTDGTREIVFEYQQKYPDIIRVITSDKNVGAKKNSMRTLKACTGKYIAYCEGDDYWHNPDKMQKQVDYMESHSGCGMVFTDYNAYFDRSNELIRSCNYYQGYRSLANYTIEQIIAGDHPREITCTVMIRRDLTEQLIESDPFLHQSGEFLMGDIQTWAELAVISDVTYIPESMATYRILVESASRSKSLIKVLKFWQSDSVMRLYLFDKYNLSKNLRQQLELGWCNRSLALAFQERNANLADEVRKIKKIFTTKDWLKYYGAKSLVVYSVYRATVFLLHLLRSKTDDKYREFGYAPRELCRLTRDINIDKETGVGRHL